MAKISFIGCLEVPEKFDWVVGWSGGGGMVWVVWLPELRLSLAVTINFITCSTWREGGTCCTWFHDLYMKQSGLGIQKRLYKLDTKFAKTGSKVETTENVQNLSLNLSKILSRHNCKLGAILRNNLTLLFKAAVRSTEAFLSKCHRLWCLSVLVLFKLVIGRQFMRVILLSSHGSESLSSPNLYWGQAFARYSSTCVQWLV